MVFFDDNQDQSIEALEYREKFYENNGDKLLSARELGKSAPVRGMLIPRDKKSSGQRFDEL